jgi:hypothetical protein
VCSEAQPTRDLQFEVLGQEKLATGLDRVPEATEDE